MVATVCKPIVRPSKSTPLTAHQAERVTVRRYTRFADVEPLRAEWDALAESVGADLFSSFDWCSTWWRHFGDNRQLEIYIARRGGGLVGCVPLYRETLSYGVWRLFAVRLVGSGDAGTRCHLPVRADVLDEVLREVCCQIDSGGSWDVIHFGDIPSNSFDGPAVAWSLGSIFPMAKIVFRSGHCPTSTYELPGTFDEYLQLLSAKERSSIRRTQRRIKEDHQGEIVPTCETSLDEVFARFLHQHEAWWGKKGQLGFFRTWPGLIDYHLDFSRIQARHGRLHLLCLQTKDAPIAYYYGHRFGKRIHAFSGARSCDPRWDALAPGKQLHFEMVRRAIESGVTHIDSMDGYYQYKELWGASYHKLQSVTVLSEKISSCLARRDFLLAWRMHHLWNRIWFWHAAPWLRQKFPQLRSTWLRAGLGSRYMRSRFLEYSTDENATDSICFFGSV
jgi:CelD/BcsL family acetyltransferase involved in cellulose biosynthesis